jgi:hypothetical protein
MNSSEQPREVQMTFQDGDSEGLLVTPLGPNLYRLEESSVFGEASYHDVVETEAQTDRTLRFMRVLTPSGLKTVSRILPQAKFESPALSALLDKVMAVGGNWERIFGGVILLHLPPAEQDLIVGEFNSLFGHLPVAAPDR